MNLKLLIISLLFFSGMLSCSPDDKIDLSDGWMMKVGDSGEYKNPTYDDSSWERVDLPRILTKERRRQIIWLRNTFTLPAEYRGRDLAVQIGKVWEADRTYLNGIQIGMSGEEFPDHLTYWNHDRYYHIPEPALRHGEKNVIAVRIFTNHISMFEGRPFIADVRAVRTYNFFRRIVSEYTAISLTVLSFFIGIIFFFQYLSNRKYRLPLHYSICSFLLGISVVQYYAPDIALISTSTKDNLFYSLMGVLIMYFYFLYEQLLDEKSRLLRVLLLMIMTLAIFIALTADADDPVQGWRMDIVGTLAFAGYILWGVLIFKSFMKKRSKEVYIFASGYIIYMLFSMKEILMMTGIINPGVSISAIGFSIIHVCHGIVLAMRTSVAMKTDALKKYLPPQLVDSIIKGKHQVEYENERRKLTVFFSDIKGFTETTDNMEAEELSALLNEYLNEMTIIANLYGGTVDKFVGDAIMIFFGAPESKGEKEDAVSCVSMAVEMQKRMKELQRAWFEKGFESPLQIRIGINTGTATVGNFGAEERLSYTAIGGQVNLAARLESACEPGGILISHSTRALVKDDITCSQREEKISVKGIRRELIVYDVVF